MARGLTLLEQQLVLALQPFADFHVSAAPDQHVITQGSGMAKRQLTMGDCRTAVDLLASIEAGGRG